jgi:hypothetical protein
MPGGAFDAFEGGEDPARTQRRAHASAAALLSRARDADDEVVERIVRHADEHGLDIVAQLWAVAGPRTLPGALWRLHLLRAAIRDDAEGNAYAFRRGTELLPTIHPVVAGAPVPTGPSEIRELADEILRGVYRGDLASALDRAAAYSRVAASGWLDLADAREAGDPVHASTLTARAARLSTIAADLEASAALERREALD